MWGRGSKLIWPGDEFLAGENRLFKNSFGRKESKHICLGEEVIQTFIWVEGELIDLARETNFLQERTGYSKNHLGGRRAN